MPGNNILIQDGVQYGIQIDEDDLVFDGQLMDAGKAAVFQIITEFRIRVRGCGCGCGCCGCGYGCGCICLTGRIRGCGRGCGCGDILLRAGVAKGQKLAKRERINRDFHVPPTDQRGKFRGQEPRIGAGDNDISQAIRQKRGDRPFPARDFLDFIDQDVLLADAPATLEVITGITIQIKIVFQRVKFQGLLVDVQDVGARDAFVHQSPDQQPHEDAFPHAAHAFQHFHHGLINERFHSAQIFFPDDKTGGIDPHIIHSFETFEKCPFLSFQA